MKGVALREATPFALWYNRQLHSILFHGLNAL